MDTTAIHALYLDGEFDLATEKLEAARVRGRIKTHDDSVFAFKHLGVMYAANYATVEKGKQFMYLLLTVEPSVRIMDMYASDMIYMIFRNVQTEFEIRHARPGNPIPDTLAPQGKLAANPRSGAAKRTAWPYWAAGALALAAGAGVAGYFIFHGDPATPAHYEGGL